ncbi:MAG: ATP-binding protein, partial [Ferruginibacter sp.]
INIHHDADSSFINYDYSDAIGKSTNHLLYNIHPLVEKQIKKIRSANDAFSETYFTGKDLEEWKKFRKRIGEKDDPRLDNNKGLYYYFYSIGIGSIGISTFGAINAEKIALLKRFRNVFSLSYQRYIDISLAEAQAREAQIEAALEKVRSRSMGMQKSEELKEVIQVVYEQFVHLNVNTEHTGFVMDYKLRDDRLIWIASKHGVPSQLTIPYFDSQYYNSFNEAKEKGWDFFATNLNFEDKNSFYRDLFKYIPDLPEEAKKFYFNCPGLAISTVLLENVGLYIENFEGIPYSDEDNATLMRFGKVFQQTYTRFLDLQKAEAQSREAQIQLALERVRSKAMAMHHSDELDEVLAVLCDQFDVLGILPMSTHMTVMDLENNSFTFRETGKFGDRSFGEQTVDLDAMDTWKETVDTWKQSKALSINRLHFPKEILPQVWEVFHESFASMPEGSRITPNDYPDGIYHTAGKHPFGYIGMNQTRKATEEEEQIVIKFANEFGIAYQRFLDLQKAEAQAREAQIEYALEKVRSRTMAMQKSEELHETSQILFQQMKELGEPVEQLTIGIVKETENVVEVFATVQGSQLQQSFRHSIDEPTVMNKIYRGWKAQQKSLLVELNSDEIQVYNLYRNELVKSEMFSTTVSKDERRILYAAYFSKGMLALGSNTPLSEESHRLLERFAGVFDGTYTRFLDLQKAEAQAREAQIESALERVRSRSLAMHNTSELQSVIHTVHKELLNLNIAVNGGSFIAINSDIENKLRCWGSGGTADTTEEVHLPIYEKPFCTNLINRIKKGPGFFMEEYTQKEKYEFFKFILKYEPWSKLDVKQKNETLSSPGGYTRSCCVSQHTSIFIINHFGENFSDTDNDILKRFGKVFEQTYTRFLDLKKAEAQARESQIETGLEKVRSRTLAMQKSDELAETAAEVFKQLIGLGIEPNRLYIGIVKDESGDMEMWATDEDGTKVGQKFMFNKNENASVKKLYDGWAAKEKSVIVDMEGKELEDYFHYLNDVMHIPFKAGLTQKRRVQSVAYFSKGFIGMASPDGQGNETIQLLERFAAVFNLTFTRFNDLKIAEAHAEQAEQDLIAIKEAKQKAEDALIELQATQKQLIQSEKMASLGELTAGIAHEIQNPLNFVNNFSEVSKELLDEMKTALDNGDSVDAKELANDVIQNLEKINHHGKRADAIVKGMLQHSRSSSGQKEPTDINALCDEYLRLSYHGLRAKDKSFNATFKTDFDESLEKINIIPQDIGRVVLNLLTNAFYAVDEKKKLGIENYEPAVSISTKKINDKVEIKVTDNGNGIPQKVLDKIFQPFFTTKPTGQGTGLGLSLSYDIVTKGHGGELKVETTEGKGSTFIIQLPV